MARESSLVWFRITLNPELATFELVLCSAYERHAAWQFLCRHSSEYLEVLKACLLCVFCAEQTF